VRITWSTLLALVLLGTPARAQSVELCVSSYDRAQRLRHEEKLILARQELIVCGQASCPEQTAGECARWLHDVNDAVPSIVITARDATGADLIDVAVEVDGVTLARHLEGKAIELDPGEHRLRLRAAWGDSIERRVVADEGVKNKKVEIIFSAPPLKQAAARVPVPTWVLGAFGVTALGVGAGLDVVSYDKYVSLRDTCDHHCDPAQVDRYRVTMIAGDVLLSVGVVAVGAALWIYLAHRAPSADTPSRPASSIDWLHAEDGGAVRVRF
jgi:hypothetical protein